MPQIDRLVSLMARLRSPTGCPWDLEQTHESLKTYLLEEAYEVLEAIDSGSDEDTSTAILQVVTHENFMKSGFNKASILYYLLQIFSF